MANIVRERLNGDKTYFIHNRHINPTNVCVLSCQFCAFGVKAEHPNAYEKSLEEIFFDAEKYREVIDTRPSSLVGRIKSGKR